MQRGAGSGADGAGGTIRARLDEARRELLDLGLRNTLLNYRPLASRGIDVQEASASSLYRILVSEGRQVSFLPVPEAPRPGSLPTRPQRPRQAADDELQTPYESRQLQRRLLSTHYAARTQLEEQGVNVLFLALGMLEWREADDAEAVHLAPRVLIPVQLERASVQAPFRIEHSGEDIGENLSLREKLRHDFGLKLPSFPDDELDIDGYFCETEIAVAGLDGWRVDRRRAALGYFSFAKFLMYHDLDADVWPDTLRPTDHPVLSSLLGDGFREPASQTAASTSTPTAGPSTK
ncbi:MAG: DUF4011 domain-containing protein [Candidatus Latescibacterota bacterium]